MELEFDQLVRELDSDPDFRAARRENDVRRQLAQAFDARCEELDVGVRELARKMDTSAAQVRRLLHRSQGGSLTLRTIVKAADVLECDIEIELRPRRACLLKFPDVRSWNSAGHGVRDLPLHVAATAAPCRAVLVEAKEWQPARYCDSAEEVA